MCTCGQPILVTWPPGFVEKLKAKGMVFRSGPPPVSVSVMEHEPPPSYDEASSLASSRRPAAEVNAIPTPPPARPHTPKAPPPPEPRMGLAPSAGFGAELGTAVPTRIDATEVAADPPTFGLGDRTVPSGRSPYGSLPGNAPEPDSRKPMPTIPGTENEWGDSVTAADARTEDASPKASPVPAQKAAIASANPKPAQAAKPVKKRTAVGCVGRMAAVGLPLAGIALIAGLAVAGGGYVYFSHDLPSVEALQAYEPSTSTIIYDRNGEIMGEIFEERRYVVPLETIPDNVQNAFISAEDANFWTHGGVDYVGVVRAVLRNAAEGKKAQGASTITQQVTRNFLLTREKTITRKIKEVLLSWRIEDVYDKKHILYLYLNEIYLGSGAYGIEAASRVYFDKHVGELDLAQAAMLAGLPPAPSTYSPHRNFDKAKERQKYVLDQMVKNKYIDQPTADAAYAEKLVIAPQTSDFLHKAPHFTEHVRRHLVEQYGEEAVLHGGLEVHTTCDLKLQTLAQDVLVDNVDTIDQRMGYRREGVITLADDKAITAKRDEEEAAMKKAWAKAQDPAGRVDEPDVSILEPDHTYEAVVLEAHSKWAKVAIGKHDAVVPLAWSDWVYEPNPNRSWRNREAVDLTAMVDSDGDGKKDRPILGKGDVVEIEVVGTSTKEAKIAKLFAGTPGETSDLAAVRLWQEPEVESTMMSFDLATGAVRSMVGGADFATSQFIRATQARRQVGSTFKPIVYGAALSTRRITAATMVADAPLAFATDNDFVWKPSNYANDYLGIIPLRKALALSRNTCTVRVLETMDPGMNNDVVYKFSRKLGIGGPPSYTLPPDYVTTPDNDHLCPWTQETPDSTICMSHYPPRTDKETNTKHRANLKPDDVHMCRTCDYSMALGSASLTMEELLRAYSAFGTGGKLVQPYYIDEVKDRHGNVLEKHDTVDFPQVIDPGVATIVNWLLQGVVNEGTAAAANGMGLTIGGKTGTTNDEKDAWFVGLTPNVITGVWVGYDRPQSLGVSSTGGKTALPIWMDYMKVAAPKETNSGPFKTWGDIEWAQIDETNGARVTSGGRSYPFLKGTAPESTGAAAGQVTLQQLTTEL